MRLSLNQQAKRRVCRERVTAIYRVTLVATAMIFAGGFTICLFAAVYFVSTNAINFALN